MNNAFHLSDRAVIRISGEDRKAFLQGVITQDIERLNPGEAAFSALLTPQGKILFDFIIVENDEGYLVDCSRDHATALIKRLSLYKLRAKVTIELDETLVVTAAVGNMSSDGVIAFQDPRHSGIGWRAITPADTHYATDQDYDERRIKLGVPEFGKDFSSDEMFLLDVNYDALNGVSYQKGCFIGQEVTSRMKRKGDARRRALVAIFAGPVCEPEAAVTAGDLTLGQIMSTSTTAALANIRLDRWEKAVSSKTPIEAGGRQLSLQIPAYLEHR